MPSLQIEKQRAELSSSKKYLVRYTHNELLINGEPIDYGNQILGNDWLYIIQTIDATILELPIALAYTNEIDNLDRKIFYRHFIHQIIKTLEICTVHDSVFILKRIPQHIKYVIGIVQRLTLYRWEQLLSQNEFYLAFYQTLQRVITQRQISILRCELIRNLLETSLKTVFARLCFLIESVVLEDQNLRISLNNLTRKVALKEMQSKCFFEKYVLTSKKMESSIKKQESPQKVERIEDLTLETDQREEKRHECSENFLVNSTNLIKSCQKFKISKQIIQNKILNQRFFTIFTTHFRQFFERNRKELLSLIAIVFEFSPIKMWNATFQDQKQTSAKNLLLFQSMLISSLQIHNEQSTKKKDKTSDKRKNQKKIKGEQIINALQINQEKQQAFAILQKMISLHQNECENLIFKIMSLLLNTKFIERELRCIELFLENYCGRSINKKKYTELCQLIIKKIQNNFNKVNDVNLQIQVNFSSNENDHEKPASKFIKQQIQDNQNSQAQLTEKKQRMQTQFNQINEKAQRIKLPFSKPTIITLMKIYKIFIKNRKQYNLQLDVSCLENLIKMTQKKRGVIEGVRQDLVQLIKKQTGQTKKFTI